MNEKLKGILHTGWTEPRHFFFWLALFSAAGLSVSATRIMALKQPNLPMGLFTLICGLCLLTSLTAFALAWLPPLRRPLSLLLGKRFLVLGCVVTLIALFYAIEDWRGRSAWQHFKRAGEAQGERFDLASLAPAPVPDDQNFFEAPLWNFLHFTQTPHGVVWSDTNWGDHVVFDAFGPHGNNSPRPGNWTKAQPADLGAWQAFYRGTNNLFRVTDGSVTNYFPVAAQPQSPAADVLLALSRFDATRQLLIAAAARPKARFWINYDAGPAMMLPHLARMKASVQYLALHADAALRAGDKETALEDLKLMFRLIDSIRGEPILISHLVRIAGCTIGLEPLWEGLADRQWRETDLRSLESELAKLDFLADYHLALEGEQGCNLWELDYVRKNGLEGMDQVFGQSHEGADLGFALFRLIPGGWFDQNKLSVCRTYRDFILPEADTERRVISPSLVRRCVAAQEAMSLGPYDVFAKRYLPADANALRRFAWAQAAVDQARVACALEQYRLANGQFPATLEELAPQFISKLPNDVINGQPLKYRRTEDGQFVLYSVGWNETDDGGKIGLTKNGYLDQNQGDWVWHYPAKTGSKG
ncbi:conserved membrane hypothetical protein [Verrucomicrobia bacterium]|nr:conserved membrane hypothetical protein [Verrucomicrobiota bacterium]